LIGQRTKLQLTDRYDPSSLTCGQPVAISPGQMPPKLNFSGARRMAVARPSVVVAGDPWGVFSELGCVLICAVACSSLSRPPATLFFSCQKYSCSSHCKARRPCMWLAHRVGPCRDTARIRLCGELSTPAARIWWRHRLGVALYLDYVSPSRNAWTTYTYSITRATTPGVCWQGRREGGTEGTWHPQQVVNLLNIH
jgi:hypothetical protein